MILRSPRVDPAELERRTGWAIKPEGACKDERCVLLPPNEDDRLDARVLAERLGMPLVRDETTGLLCLGPESGGRAFASTVAPDLELPDLEGRPFGLKSLRGRKVLLYAWASW